MGLDFVDRYNATTNSYYEFAGCFYYGCVKSYVESDVNPVTKVPYSKLYHLFSEKVVALGSQHGVWLVVMLECEWKSLTNSDLPV